MKKGMSSIVSIFFITLSVLILVSFMGYYANYNINRYIKIVENSKQVQDNLVDDVILSDISYYLDQNPILYNVINEYDNINIFLTFDQLKNNITSLDGNIVFSGNVSWSDGVIDDSFVLNNIISSSESLNYDNQYSLGFHFNVDSSVDGDIISSPMLDIYVDGTNMVVDEACLTQFSFDSNEWNSFFMIRNSNGFKIYVNDILKKDVSCALGSSTSGPIVIGGSSGYIDNFFIVNDVINQNYHEYLSDLLLYNDLIFVTDNNINSRLYVDHEYNVNFYKKSNLKFKEISYVKGESYVGQDEYIIHDETYSNLDRDKNIYLMNENGIEDYSFFKSNYDGLVLAYDFEGPVGLYNYDKSQSNNLDLSGAFVKSGNDDNYLDLSNGAASVNNLDITYDEFIIGFRLNLKESNVFDTLVEKENSFIVNLDAKDVKYSIDFGRFKDGEADFVSGAHQNSSVESSTGEGNILYFEDFNSTDLTDWTQHGGGTWEVLNNQLQTSGSGYLTILGNSVEGEFFNFTYKALVNRDNNKNMGIIFNYFDQNNYWALNTWENERIVVGGRIDGSAYYAGDLLESDFLVDDTNTDTWYWFEVYRNDTHIAFKHWELGSSEPSSWEMEIYETRMLGGSIGLYGWANTVYYDNLTVEEIGTGEIIEGSEGDYSSGSGNPKILRYDNWYNILISYDETDGAKIFVNNELYANSSLFSGSIDLLSSDLLFNKNLTLNAKIDDFFIVNNLDLQINNDFNVYRTFFKDSMIYFIDKLIKADAYFPDINEIQLYPSFDNFVIDSTLENLVNANYYTQTFNFSFPQSISIDVSDYDKYIKNKLYLDFSNCNSKIEDYLDNSLFINIDYTKDSPGGMECSMVGNNNYLSDRFKLNVTDYELYFFIKSMEESYEILSYSYDDLEIKLYRNETNIFMSFNESIVDFEVDETWSLISIIKESDDLKIYLDGIFKAQIIDYSRGNKNLYLEFFKGNYLINSLLFTENLIDKSNEFISQKSILPNNDFDFIINHYCKDNSSQSYSNCNSATSARYHKFALNSDSMRLSKFDIVDSKDYLLIKNLQDIEYEKEDIEIYVQGEYQSRNKFIFLDKDKYYSETLLKNGYIALENQSNIIITTSNGNKFRFN